MWEGLRVEAILFNSVRRVWYEIYKSVTEDLMALQRQLNVFDDVAERLCKSTSNRRANGYYRAAVWHFQV